MKITNDKGVGGGVSFNCDFFNPSLVNLHNRVREERRRQTLCDKRDNNNVWKNPPPIFKSKKHQCWVNFWQNMQVAEPIMFVTLKRFAVLFFLLSGFETHKNCNSVQGATNV